MAQATLLVVAGLSNAYAGYVTTAEEYDKQHYEGGSTHFGRWTLAAYATNLLDEEYVQFRQPTLNRAMYGAPRVFGAVLETRW